MTCTLDLYTDYLLSSTEQTSSTGLSRLTAGAVSRDQVTRWLVATYLDGKQLWKAAKPLVHQAESRQPAEEFAVLLVDDTVVEKPHTEENALICTHYEHSQRRCVRGLNIVSLLYQGHGLALPIAAELVEKTQGEAQFGVQERVAAGHVAPSSTAGDLPLPTGRQLVRLGREHD